ncbi:MAG: hypothetical protein R2748_10495 [Bryobacterales bacterium]
MTKSHAKLLGVIAGFDGVLQLLPHGGSLDCYDAQTWQTLYDHDVPPSKRGIFSSKVATEKSAKIDWAKPDAALLAEARRVRDLLQSSPIEPGRMLYVAGKARTACDVKVVPENREGRQVVVLATERGDGRVPWETGIPPRLGGSTYYMDASRRFGQPRARLSGFAGSTRARFDIEAAADGAVGARPLPETFEMREPRVETYPNRGDLIALAMGGAWSRARTARRRPRSASAWCTGTCRARRLRPW